jgi:ATP-binding cassette subfamily B protein
VPAYRQRGAHACGTTCLAMIFSFFGVPNVQTLLGELAGVRPPGTDMASLAQLARDFGFDVQGIQIETGTRLDVPLPCIAHIDGNHFVVVAETGDGVVYVNDPAVGRCTLSDAEFWQRATGAMLLVAHDDRIDVVAVAQARIDAHARSAERYAV